MENVGNRYPRELLGLELISEIEQAMRDVSAEIAERIRAIDAQKRKYRGRLPGGTIEHRRPTLLCGRYKIYS